MIFLIIGLMIFFGTHSLFIFANDWRLQQKEKLGTLAWKGLFSIVSLLGFVLIVWGYDQTRLAPTYLWHGPIWLRHLASLLVLVAFIVLMATYVPGTYIKQKLGHPMLVATKAWAFAHLLVNGAVADVILFGTFLVWAIAGYAVCRRRDRALGVTRPAIGISRDIIALVIGIVAFAGFTFYLHKALIGVAPFTMG